MNVSTFFSPQVAGIPFAALYGFLLVWIVSDLIIGKPGASFGSDSNPGLETLTAKNICATILSEHYNGTVTPTGVPVAMFVPRVRKNVTHGRNIQTGSSAQTRIKRGKLFRSWITLKMWF